MFYGSGSRLLNFVLKMNILKTQGYFNIKIQQALGTCWMSKVQFFILHLEILKLTLKLISIIVIKDFQDKAMTNDA
jgi:hypothetical protein